MGTTISEVLTKIKDLNKNDYLNLIISVMGKDNPDYDYDSLIVSNGYEMLPIYDNRMDCFKIGKYISDKLDVITISIYICDSDYACFQLIDREKVIDITLNKKLALSYGEIGIDKNVELLVGYIDDDFSIEDIYKIIDSEYTFAEDGLCKLLALFCIDADNIIY